MSAGYKTKRQLLEEVRAPHRINKVLITGNGFDVALGYKTSFKDFIKFSKEYIKDKNNDREEFFKILSCNHLYKYFANRDINTWNNLESELEKIINGIIKTFDNNPIINKPLSYFPGMTKPIISVYDEMTKKVLTEFDVIQSSYYDSWVVNDFFEDEILWDRLIALFEKDLEKFIEAFTLYLNKYLIKNSDNSIIGKENIIYKVIKSIEPDFIQTFNYTEVYKDVYNTSYVTHLHGKARDNSIILGYEKESDEYRFANYRKSFQRINKKNIPDPTIS